MKTRPAPETLPRLREAFAGGESVLVEMAVDGTVAAAMVDIPRTEVPDLPDRVIAATAVSAGVPVISRDRKIQVSQRDTIW